MSKYSEKLKNPKWQKKRLQILERDEWRCQRCFDNESTLVVHHKRYIPFKEPWDYHNSYLITLCESCHEQEREARENYENNLLLILRDNFFADDLHTLILAFINLQQTMPKPPEVMAEIINFCFGNKDVLNFMETKYFEHLAKILKEAKGNKENGMD